jgi:hypothetical protein
MYTTTTSSVEKIMTDGTGSENEIHVLRTGWIKEYEEKRLIS